MRDQTADGRHAESSEAKIIRTSMAVLLEDPRVGQASKRARQEVERCASLWEQLAECFDQVAACEAEAHKFDDGSRYTPIIYERKSQ